MNEIKFNRSFAIKNGLYEAIILSWIKYKTEQELSNEVRMRVRKKWYVISFEDFCKELPFFTKGRMKNSIENLHTIGAISISKHTENRFEKSTWYTINEHFS